MKKITEKTILKQGDKEFKPIEVDGIIYWVDNKQIEGIHSMVSKIVWSTRYKKPIIFGETENSYLNECYKIIAQSQPKIEGIPIISLDSYVERLALINSKNDIPTHKEQDINTEIWISGARQLGFKEGYKSNPNKWNNNDIVKAIQFGADLEAANIRRNYKYPTAAEQFIAEELSSIELIEVNEKWEIVNFK